MNLKTSRMLPLLAAMMLAACGSKGDLYLPEDSPPEQQSEEDQTEEERDSEVRSLHGGKS